MDSLLPELLYYEKLLGLENGEIGDLSAEEMIKIADKILGYDNNEEVYFDFQGWSLERVIRKYKRGCRLPTDIHKLDGCYVCPLLGKNTCEYTKALGLAVYIYESCIDNLDRDRELLLECIRPQVVRY